MGNHSITFDAEIDDFEDFQIVHFNILAYFIILHIHKT